MLIWTYYSGNDRGQKWFMDDYDPRERGMSNHDMTHISFPVFSFLMKRRINLVGYIVPLLTTTARADFILWTKNSGIRKAH